jgi:YD repeat-containing protein
LEWSDAGTVAFDYDDAFRVSEQSVNGGSPVLYTYDGDDLPIQVGDLTLSYHSQHGLRTGTKLGTINDSVTYNPFGEATGYAAKSGSNTLYTVQYSRDKLGRITELNETISGNAAAYVYSYDEAGRLAGVQKDGVPVAGYTYDANGNRLTITAGSSTTSATYDAQDRLTHFGATSYSYTANGELASKSVGGQTTSYQYDPLGNLIRVTLPSGGKIEYLVDGLNRRIGKKVNGTLVQGFLYDGDLRPVAELDGAGKVVSRFVYATHVNVPDYMIKGGTTYRILTDHLGSPRLVVNTSNGQVAQRID